MDVPLYYRYWGKAGALDRDGQVSGVHLLPYHCLDVAAVGAALIRQHGVLRDRLPALTGLGELLLDDNLPFLLALHDLGKFSEGFQNLVPTVFQQLQGRASRKASPVRHDSLGFLLWKKHLAPRLFPPTAGRRTRRSEAGLDNLLRAVTGHHGRPPREGQLWDLKHYFSDRDIAAAEAFVGALRDQFQPDLDRLKALDTTGWWLGGMTVLCDWLGSDAARFSAQSHEMSLHDYWGQIQDKAREAAARSGILPVATSARFTLADCLPGQHEEEIQATPLQAFAAQATLPDGPQLWVLEDVTGAGKTEAALLLAHRLMREKAYAGIYVGLPTMATANGMYRRFRGVYRRLFDDKATPSLVLAHSASRLSPEFRDSLIPPASDAPSAYGDGTEPASAYCAAWLGDNHKKALLAHVGVGTIDQALLAVLPVKHQSLRLLGLPGKVLVVDEVHAYDRYTGRLLRALLEVHARAGGSAILLSATLPTAQRRELLAAYAGGLGAEPPQLQATASGDYPLTTAFGTAGLSEHRLPTRAGVGRSVEVQRLSDPDGVLQLIASEAGAGRCACWIRNTVPDALHAYRALRQRYPDLRVDLFHARFALADRLDIENRVLDHFGPGSEAKLRRGRVLIATQVVEQSLDLDFDVLATDLAPVDLVIQRAGRLRRHHRDAAGNRVVGPDRRGDIRLHLLAPDPIPDADREWFTDLFPKAGRIYPDHGQLWLTADLLTRMQVFRMPEDARVLVEGVYGEEARTRLPAALQDVSWSAVGEGLARESLAAQNAIKLSAGYRDSTASNWWEEAITPTRDGEDTITVYLARLEPDGVRPWADGELAWARSELRLPLRMAAAEGRYPGLEPEQLQTWKAQLPGNARWGLLLPLSDMGDGLWKGQLCDREGRSKEVSYSREWGFMETRPTEDN